MYITLSTPPPKGYKAPESARTSTPGRHSTSATIAKTNALTLVSKSRAQKVEHLTWSRLRARTRHVEVGDENGGGGERGGELEKGREVEHEKRRVAEIGGRGEGEGSRKGLEKAVNLK